MRDGSAWACRRSHPFGRAEGHGARVGEQGQQQQPTVGVDGLLPECGRVFQTAVEKPEQPQADENFDEVECVLSGRVHGVICTVSPGPSRVERTWLERVCPGLLLPLLLWQLHEFRRRRLWHVNHNLIQTYPLTGPPGDAA